MTKEDGKIPIINLSSSGNPGDTIAGLTVAASFKRANVYLTIGPLMPQKLANALIPLVLRQPYINECKIFDGTTKIDLNLDDFRGISSLKYDFLHSVQLGKFHRYWNLANPWITNIEPIYVNDIVLNRTTRYHGEMDYYSLCKKYEGRVTFLGFKDEHESFCKLFHVDIPRHETPTFLDVAQVIKGSKLYVGNQSSCWWVAEGMKHPRLVEVCEVVPNSMPIGVNGHCDWEDDYFDLIEGYLK